MKILKLLDVKKLTPVFVICIICLGCRSQLQSRIFFTPTSAPPHPTKQIISINLPLVEKWRWAGTTYDLITITPEDRVIISSDHWGGETVIIFDAYTGDVIWESESIGNLISLYAYDKRVFVGSITYVRAYDLETGQALWEGARQPRYKRGGLYVYSNGDQLEVYDPHDGYIYILDFETGQTTKKIRQALPFFKKDELLFSGVCGGSYNMNCLDATNMLSDKLLWSHSFGGGVYRWPVFIDDMMIVNGAGRLFAIKVNTGDIVWQSSEANIVSNIAMGHDLLYAIRDDAAIVGFDPKTGKLVGVIEMIPNQTPDTNNAGYTTYYTIAASDKFLAAYYGDSQELIVFEKVDGMN